MQDLTYTALCILLLLCHLFGIFRFICLWFPKTIKIKIFFFLAIINNIHILILYFQCHFFAPKLVWDLLSRPSAQTVHPFICLSVYPSVRPLPCPPFVSLFLRQPVHPTFFNQCIFPFLVCPSDRPTARPPSFNSFVSLSVCPFVCQSIRFPVYLSFHSYIWVSVSPSINGSICPSVYPVRRSDLSFWPSVCPSVSLSLFPNTYAVVLSFVRPSICPSNHLSIYNGYWVINLISRNFLLLL